MKPHVCLYRVLPARQGPEELTCVCCGCLYLLPIYYPMGLNGLKPLRK